MIPITKIFVNTKSNNVTFFRGKSILMNCYTTTDKRIDQLANAVNKEAVTSYRYSVRPLITLASWGWELKW